jgi:hypothetical protein
MQRLEPETWHPEPETVQPYALAVLLDPVFGWSSQRQPGACRGDVGMRQYASGLGTTPLPVVNWSGSHRESHSPSSATAEELKADVYTRAKFTSPSKFATLRRRGTADGQYCRRK